MEIIKKACRAFRRPVKRRYVFIITYGRSGSTLLMNLINSCEGCCIKGENNGALYSIYECYNKIIDAQCNHGKNSDRPTSPWRGITDVDAQGFGRKLANSFVDEVINPGRNDFLCGFKEIRFSCRDVPDLQGYVRFLYEFFPGTQIIFNHRRLENVAASKWWAKVPDAASMLKAMDERFNDFEESPTVFHFYYDRAVVDVGHVRDMCKFLNIPYSESAVREVFGQRHSY